MGATLEFPGKTGISAVSLVSAKFVELEYTINLSLSIFFNWEKRAASRNSHPNQ